MPDTGMLLTVRRLDRADASGWAVLRRQALELHPLAFGATVPDEPYLLVERFLERVVPADEAAVGALLLQRAISHARTWAGVEQIHLTVSEAAVEAQRLYAAHGFRPWGREPRALQWAGTYVDEIRMVLDLVASRQTA